MRDKCFLNKIRKIIKIYLPNLFSMFSKLTDKRNESYITYNIQAIIITKIIA